MYRCVWACDPAGYEDKKKMMYLIIGLILAFLFYHFVIGDIPYGYEDEDGFHYGEKTDEN